MGLSKHQQQNRACMQWKTTFISTLQQPRPERLRTSRVQRLWWVCCGQTRNGILATNTWSGGTTTCTRQKSEVCQIRHIRHQINASDWITYEALNCLNSVKDALVVNLSVQGHQCQEVGIVECSLFTCQTAHHHPAVFRGARQAAREPPIALITTNPTGGNSDHPQPVVSKTSLDHRETCLTTLMSIISRPLMREPPLPFPWKLVRSRKEGKHHKTEIIVVSIESCCHHGVYCIARGRHCIPGRQSDDFTWSLLELLLSATIRGSCWACCHEECKRCPNIGWLRFCHLLLHGELGLYVWLSNQPASNGMQF